jgi:Fe-S oxidoreductase
MNNFIYSNTFNNKAKEFSDSCTNCKICVRECEMLNNFKISPKDFFNADIEQINVNPSIPYSCNTCGTCTKVCPKGLNLEELFVDMRKEHIKNNRGKSPIKGHKIIEFHQTFSFSKMFNVAIPDAKAGYTKRVFIPGCSLASYSQELVEKTLEYLQERLPGTGAILKCCGKPTLSLGQEERFHKRYSELQAEIDKLGAEEVITACQNCYITMSQFSPNQKVRSLWTIIPELGIYDEMKGKGKNSNITFGIHDACPTRNNSDIHEGIRWIINELGYRVKETEYSRENTRCCGFGGMVVPANPKLSEKVMRRSGEKSEEEYIITYCASCREAMTIAQKKSLHILDLMFNDRYNTTSQIPGLNKSFIKSWITRYKSKEVLKNKGNL